MPLHCTVEATVRGDKWSEDGTVQTVAALFWWNTLKWRFRKLQRRAANHQPITWISHLGLVSPGSRTSRWYTETNKKRPHPLKQGCVDNIDFSCHTLTDKKTLWPRCGRHMLGLNRCLCLVDGAVVGVWLVLRNEDFVTACCFLRSCHRCSRWITHAEFSCSLCQEPRGMLWRTGLVFLP